MHRSAVNMPGAQCHFGYTVSLDRNSGNKQSSESGPMLVGTRSGEVSGLCVSSSGIVFDSSGPDFSTDTGTSNHVCVPIENGEAVESCPSGPVQCDASTSIIVRSGALTRDDLIIAQRVQRGYRNNHTVLTDQAGPKVNPDDAAPTNATSANISVVPTANGTNTTSELLHTLINQSIDANAANATAGAANGTSEGGDCSYVFSQSHLRPISSISTHLSM